MIDDVSPGNVFIVAAPSGGGKTSLVKELVTQLANIEVSISHTTRQPRPNEVDGVDYFFVSVDQFKEMINEAAFIEYAQVFDRYYGTSTAQINERLIAGIDVVLDIDWQGAQQIRKIFPHAISIFIIPPSLQVLQERLKNRQQDDDATIAARMQQAQNELSHFPEFDYWIINEDFQKAAQELQAIVISNRLSAKRQVLKIGKLLSLLVATQ